MKKKPSVSPSRPLDDLPFRSFDRLLQNTIEAVLERVFSELSARLILHHVERNYNTRLEMIPRRAESFSHALRDIFGDGSVIIENLILKNLYSDLGLEFEGKAGYGFPDHIKELRNRFEELQGLPDLHK